MPAELRERDPWKESTKKAVKSWVKEHVGSRGEDHILWGRWQMEEVQEGGTEQKRKKPPTSNKQMKKCGEPARKGKGVIWISRMMTDKAKDEKRRKKGGEAVEKKENEGEQVE